VIKDGKLVTKEGHLMVPLSPVPPPKGASMKIKILDSGSFAFKSEHYLARIIGIIPNQIITKSLSLPPKVDNSWVVADTQRDILKMAVVERHKATGNIGLGLVQGFGLQAGAIATSVAHDSHNVVTVGVSDDDMLTAVLKVKEMGGGLVVAKEGQVKSSVALPIAGLLSEKSMQEVANGINHCIEAAQDLGSILEDPFMTLSFLSLPVIPELKLTDKGLVDVTKFKFVPLFMEHA
jgi:adenine deaminase